MDHALWLLGVYDIFENMICQEANGGKIWTCSLAFDIPLGTIIRCTSKSARLDDHWWPRLVPSSKPCILLCRHLSGLRTVFLVPNEDTSFSSAYFECAASKREAGVIQLYGYMALFSSSRNSKSFEDSPSRQIFWHIHEALNIEENKN